MIGILEGHHEQESYQLQDTVEDTSVSFDKKVDLTNEKEMEKVAKSEAEQSEDDKEMRRKQSCESPLVKNIRHNILILMSAGVSAGVSADAAPDAFS